MAMTFDDVTEYVNYVYAELIPEIHDERYRGDRKQESWDEWLGIVQAYEAEGYSPSDSLAGIMKTFPAHLARLISWDDRELTVPWHVPPGILPTGWEKAISAEEIVSFFAPDMSPAEQAKLIAAIEAGEASAVDFAASIVLVSVEGGTLTAEAVLDHATTNGLVPEGSITPPAEVGFHESFAIGLYVAAFKRAGEFDGVNHWKSALQDKIDAGIDGGAALQSLAGDMYYAGWLHGEGGTDIEHTAAYIQHVYQNVLGRSADAEGLAYWFEEIEQGTVAREKFLADFLYAAMQDQGDGNYLAARLEVAKYVAREDVSGSGKSLDLAGVLDGVTDAASAYLRIEAIKAGEFSVATVAGLAAMSSPLQLDDDLVLLLESWELSPDTNTGWTAPHTGDHELVVVGDAGTGAEGGDWFA